MPKAIELLDHTLAFWWGKIFTTCRLQKTVGENIHGAWPHSNSREHGLYAPVVHGFSPLITPHGIVRQF